MIGHSGRTHGFHFGLNHRVGGWKDDGNLGTGSQSIQAGDRLSFRGHECLEVGVVSCSYSIFKLAALAASDQITMSDFTVSANSLEEFPIGSTPSAKSR